MKSTDEQSLQFSQIVGQIGFEEALHQLSMLAQDKADDFDSREHGPSEAENLWKSVHDQLAELSDEVGPTERGEKEEADKVALMRNALEGIIDLPADDAGERIIPAGFLDKARAALKGGAA